MILKYYKPITSSLRGKISINKSSLNKKNKCARDLILGKQTSGGRNNFGRITLFHKGGGHKRLYRIIDFQRKLFNTNAVVKQIEYDPNRSAYIALIQYENGIFSYILAPHTLCIGDTVISGKYCSIIPGNALPIKYIPIGTIVHNIEVIPGSGGQLVRAAGTNAQLIKKDNQTDFGTLRLSSGEHRLINLNCMATVGTVSNADYQNIVKSKAGVNRWLNKRPIVRGVAMNPIDHPHGGGQGKTSGGRPSCTPWGIPTKGKKTRKNKRTSKFIITKQKIL